MAIISFSDFQAIREKHKNEKVVFCSGSFDLTHAGHVLFFEDCKKHGDILVVGVGSDEVIRESKGSERPIINEHARLMMIDAIKPVDYTFLDTRHVPGDTQLGIECALQTLRPEIYVINEDAHDIQRREQWMKEIGGTLVILNRWCPAELEKISTTKIIEKIRNLKK